MIALISDIQNAWLRRALLVLAAPIGVSWAISIAVLGWMLACVICWSWGPFRMLGDFVRDTRAYCGNILTLAKEAG